MEATASQPGGEGAAAAKAPAGDWTWQDVQVRCPLQLAIRARDLARQQAMAQSVGVLPMYCTPASCRPWQCARAGSRGALAPPELAPPLSPPSNSPPHSARLAGPPAFWAPAPPAGRPR